MAISARAAEGERVLASFFEPPIASACLDLEHEVPDLLPEEAQILRGPTPARQLEFAGGRSCARRALARLGVAPCAIGMGASGEPLWPEGIVGAISHAGGVCVAAVGWAADCFGLGVDVEVDGPESIELTRRICSPKEVDALRQLGPPEQLARAVFSAKESLHKLQFPMTGEVVGLRRVEVTLRADTFSGTFTRDLPPPILGMVVRGRWQRSSGLVWSGAWLPSTQGPPPLGGRGSNA